MGRVKICLDAGHYGKYNRSPANSAYYESDMSWKLHNLLKKYLEQYGFEVIQTRKNQATDLGVDARGRASKGCDLFLSIHSNAVGNGVNEKIDYPVVYVPLNGSGDKLGKKLADCICSVMGTKQKGRKSARMGANGDYYGVIRGAVAVGTTGMILEHSFHTNTRSTNWLLDGGNLDKLAKAEANIIADHFGIPKKAWPEIKAGDVVSLTSDAVYYDGKVIPAWVKAKKWIVKSVSGDRAVIDKASDGGNSICSPVNVKYLVKDSTSNSQGTKNIDEIAKEVINGKWGNGAEREKMLRSAGYDYLAVQKRVNELLK